ncbi:MAG: hypothetical protein IBX60_04620 [Candidatus Aminicenantes bacterium]|nr:hypothetical protein [Candidatus Aminicenantes bacterium]
MSAVRITQQGGKGVMKSRLKRRDFIKTLGRGGQRVPYTMCWPGHIAKGTVCDKIAASTIDMLPGQRVQQMKMLLIDMDYS